MRTTSGRYNDGTPRRYRDYLRTYKGEVVNLLEVTDWGDYVCAPMDEHGNYDGMSVATLEPSDVVFLRHWDDPALYVAMHI